MSTPQLLKPRRQECGVVVASTRLVEDGSGTIPCRVILKKLKIVPTAPLFGAGHLRVRVWGSHYLLTFGSPGHGFRNQFGCLP